VNPLRTHPWSRAWAFVLGPLAALAAVSMALSLALGTYMMLFPPREARAATDFGYLGPIGLLMYPLPGYPQGAAAFTAANILYALFLHHLLRRPAPIAACIRGFSRGDLEGWMRNGACAVAFTYGFLLFTGFALRHLLDSLGVRTGSLPPQEPLPQFISIALAPINEELTFRLLIIGLAAAIISSGPDAGLRSTLRAIWRPASALGRPAALAIWVAWAIGGIYFGAAHFLYSGGAWGPGKAITASLQGLAIGLLHIYYGFHAAVMLHWAFNYHGTVPYFLEEIYGSGWSKLVGRFLGIVEILVVVAGTLLVSYSLLKRLVLRGHVSFLVGGVFGGLVAVVCILGLVPVFSWF
jgi:hypothetical protein